MEVYLCHECAFPPLASRLDVPPDTLIESSTKYLCLIYSVLSINRTIICSLSRTGSETVISSLGQQVPFSGKIPRGPSGYGVSGDHNLPSLQIGLKGESTRTVDAGLTKVALFLRCRPAHKFVYQAASGSAGASSIALPSL